MRSIKESCLDRMILVGEVFLHRATSEFVIHYHRERNHQGLQNQIIEPEFEKPYTDGEIDCRKRLASWRAVKIGRYSNDRVWPVPFGAGRANAWSPAAGQHGRQFRRGRTSLHASGTGE